MDIFQVVGITRRIRALIVGPVPWLSEKFSLAYDPKVNKKQETERQEDSNDVTIIETPNDLVGFVFWWQYEIWWNNFILCNGGAVPVVGDVDLPECGNSTQDGEEQDT